MPGACAPGSRPAAPLVAGRPGEEATGSGASSGAAAGPAAGPGPAGGAGTAGDVRIPSGTGDNKKQKCGGNAGPPHGYYQDPVTGILHFITYPVIGAPWAAAMFPVLLPTAAVGDWGLRQGAPHQKQNLAAVKAGCKDAKAEAAQRRLQTDVRLGETAAQRARREYDREAAAARRAAESTPERDRRLDREREAIAARHAAESTSARDRRMRDKQLRSDEYYYETMTPQQKRERQAMIRQLQAGRRIQRDEAAGGLHHEYLQAKRLDEWPQQLTRRQRHFHEGMPVAQFRQHPR